MPLCYSPLTLCRPVYQDLQTFKGLGRSTGHGRIQGTHGITSDRQRRQHLRNTQHQPRNPNKTSDATGAGQISLSARQNDRTLVLSKLRSEKQLLDDSFAHLQAAIDKAMELEHLRAATTHHIALQQTLQADIMALKNELEDYKDVDPRQMEKKKEEIAQARANAERWTNNIELLEGWLDRVLAIDPYQLDCLRRECYGSEYLKGEGLIEL